MRAHKHNKSSALYQADLFGLGFESLEETKWNKVRQITLNNEQPSGLGE